MYERVKNALAISVTSAVAVSALATGLIINAGGGSNTGATDPPAAADSSAAPEAGKPAGEDSGDQAAATGEQSAKVKQGTEGTKTTEDAKRLPSGLATATSFWDSATASGLPMSYRTIASPYWPLGTKVKVTYQGKSRVGVVDDFGPAQWAIKQHSPHAIIDLSRKMMADLTGVRSNAVPMKFEVVEWGDGRIYREGGAGYDLAMGTGASDDR